MMKKEKPNVTMEDVDPKPKGVTKRSTINPNSDMQMKLGSEIKNMMKK